ncbi:MAG: hypothetical protein PHS46_07865 [Candidatus Omnitrophica bacterium]|nr:hypothetical protein [Candidatus Omnitrophota bacterium]
MIGELLDLIRRADARRPWAIVDMFQEEWQRYGTIKQDRTTGNLEMSTEGCPENECIIRALQKNVLFFPLYWQESKRGGYYRFQIFDIRKREDDLEWEASHA